MSEIVASNKIEARYLKIFTQLANQAVESNAHDASAELTWGDGDEVEQASEDDFVATLKFKVTRLR